MKVSMILAEFGLSGFSPARTIASALESERAAHADTKAKLKEEIASHLNDEAAWKAELRSAHATTDKVTFDLAATRKRLRKADEALRKWHSIARVAYFAAYPEPVEDK